MRVSDTFVDIAPGLNQDCINKAVQAQKDQEEFQTKMDQDFQDHDLMTEKKHRKQRALKHEAIRIATDSAVLNVIEIVNIRLMNLDLRHTKEVSDRTDNKIVNLTAVSVIMLMLDIFMFFNGYDNSVLTSVSLGMTFSVATVTVMIPGFFKSLSLRLALIRTNTIVIAICTVLTLVSVLL